MKYPALTTLAAALALWLSSAVLAQAQMVYWRLPKGGLIYQQRNELSLVFDQCEPRVQPVPPQVLGLRLGSPSRSSQISVVNLKVNQQVIFIYPAEPSQLGKIVIPEFEVPTNKGVLRVPSAILDIAEEDTSGLAPKNDDAVVSELRLPKTQLWVGEVITADYVILVPDSVDASLASQPEWKSPGITKEDWPKPEEFSTVQNGMRYNGARYRTRLMFENPLSERIPPIHQKVNIQHNMNVFGILQRAPLRTMELTSESREVEVRQLPPAPSPSFTGATGRFQLHSTLVPNQVAEGEPVTWTLQLSGTGNWPTQLRLPPRDVPASFTVIEPRSRTEQSDGKLFEGTLVEDLVVIPPKAGSFLIPPYEFTFFNTETGAYEKIVIPSETVQVKPRATPATATPAQSTGNSPTQPRYATGSPGAHTLPSQFLPGSATAAKPWSSLWLWTLLTPWPGILVAWLMLARQKALQSDPFHSRLKHIHRAIHLLSLIPSSTAAPGKVSALRDCMDEILRGLGTSNPACEPAQIDHLAALSGWSHHGDWAALWTEATRLLYAPSAQPISAWKSQAGDLLSKCKAPPLHLKKILRHLLPLLTVLAQLTAVPLHAADSPADLYQQGKFSDAAPLLQVEVQSRPCDWVLRHNLALSLAQQGQWDHAFCHFASARLLAPRQPQVAASFEAALQRVQPEALWAQWISRPWLNSLSPWEWGTAAGLFCLLGAGALAMALVKCYQADFKLGQPSYWFGAAALALVCSLGCLGALRMLGPLASPQAAVTLPETSLKSIPSDIPQQEQKELAPLSQVIVTKQFLGWRLVRTTTGEEGWLRQEQMIPLYSGNLTR